MSGARGRLWLVPAALLVTGLLAAAASWARSGDIEAELTARSQAALASAGLSGGQVSFTGRDAKLRGFPWNQAKRAAEAVSRVDGVRVVNLVTEAGPAPAPPSEIPATTAPGAPPSTPVSPLPTDTASLQAEIDKLIGAGPITFLPDSDDLTTEGERVVRRLAQLIGRANVDAEIEVDGHVARGPGGEDAALKLSRNRAKAVARMLVDGGLPAGHVSWKGFGDTRPNRGSGDDRRVEIKVR